MNTPAQPDPLVIPPVRGRPAGTRRILALVAALAAVASLLAPAPREEAAVTLLLIDLSQSMRAGSPPRYLQAAQALTALASSQPGRIGLITCAASARLAVPPTHDRDSLLDTLTQLPREAARPELAPGPGAISGTRLADGLRMARAMLQHTGGHRVVVLFSDGDDPVPDGSATQEAARLAEMGIQLQVVQVGTPGRPEPIPMGPGDWLQWRDQPVRSTVNTTYLQAIASAAGTTLADRWQTIAPPSKSLINPQSLCLLLSLLAWVCFLTGSTLRAPSNLSAALLLLTLAMPACQEKQKTTPSAEALLRQAAALPPTDPSRSGIARQAEALLRAQPPTQATRLRLLEALVLAGESVPMDRQALLAAQELALESEPLLNDRLNLFLARIRLRLAQCKPDSTPRQNQGGDPASGESPSTQGDPGETRPFSNPSPQTKSGKPSNQSGGPMAEAALPGAGRLPVLLDDKQPQTIHSGEALDLLRTARLWRQKRESTQRPWERPATELPDW